MKKFLWILGVVAVFAVIAFNAYRAKEDNKDVFTIKALVPLSGPLAIYADDFKKGLSVAEQEIKEKYGDKIKIELEDTAGNPTQALNIYHQKIEGNKNQAVILTFSSNARALEPLLDGSIITVVTATAVKDIAHKDKKLYQISLSLKDMLDATHNYLKDKNIRTASVIYIHDEFGLEGMNRFKDGFEKNGGKVLDEIPFSMTEMDLRLQILKALEKKPDMFYVIGYGRNYGNALNQLVSLGFKGLIMTDYSYTWPGFYEQNPELADYILTVTSVESDSFKKKYKPMGMNVISIAPIHDIAVILADAYHNANGDVEKMAEYINSLKDYDGALGNLTIQERGDVHLPTQIVKIKNGENIPVEE